MIFRTLIAAIAAASMAAPGASMAQERPVSLSSDVKLVRVVRDAEDQGNAARTELVEPESVVPGDTLAFSVSYRNGGGQPVTDFVIVNPVPANVQLSDESAAASEVSIDGGKHWGMLAELTVAGEEGAERPATAADVTHLRWTIALLTPGEAGTASFRATVR
jgi:uncharacterized repeat protein (TIGR01451 family)